LILKETGKEKIKNNMIFVIAIGLLAFGTFNLSNTIYADMHEEDKDEEEKQQLSPGWRLAEIAVEQLLTIVAPIMGSLVLMTTKFLNKKGIKISQETSEYFAGIASSYVQNEGRYIFKQFRDNKEYRDQLVKGKIPDDLKNKVFNRTKANLLREIKSDSFSKATRKMLDKNLTTIIETAVTKNHQDIAKKAKNLLLDVVPTALDAALLYEEKKSFSNEDKKKIIDKAYESVKEHFDLESIIMSELSARMHLESELNRKLNPP